ncbi:MAG: hypothetical protein N4P80_02150 [Lactobacillus gasseri]|nr:hypothetical protein [Lactobacillus gasseri]
MRVIDKRDKKIVDDVNEKWHTGDIIRFWSNKDQINYGIITMDPRSTVLVIVKSSIYSPGMSMRFASEKQLKDVLHDSHKFVENTRSNDIEKVLSTNDKKYNYGDILMCKYQREDKEFDLYRISNNAAHNYTVNIIHECIGNEEAFAITETPSAEELVNLLKKRMDYEIVEKVPAYIVLGELKANEKTE